MMIGRRAQLQYLNELYEKNGSHILVVYGQRHTGKSFLLRAFTKDRICVYYPARSCSEREQRRRFAAAVGQEGETEESFLESLSKLPETSEGTRRILIIDEFQNLVKVSQSFLKEIAAYVQESKPGQGLLVILCSSSVGWVENSMVTRLGKAAYVLSGLYKIKELDYQSLRAYFPRFSGPECVETYAVLGGLPGLWQYFDDTLTVKENICRNLLNPSAALYERAERLVGEELRETGVYHTILAALATGRSKLNELYLYTGFSRAKISVYLKTLMELELVEKIFSFDTEGRENAKKGIYRIRHPFVRFYFTYIYPYGGALFSLSAEQYYDTWIAPDFGRYAEEYYKKACMQYVEEQSREGLLPFVCVKTGEWVGKTGNIDLVGQDESGRTLIGKCAFRGSFFSYEEYRRLLACAGEARLTPDCVCLFSRGGFDRRLTEEAEKSDRLLLLQPDRV